MAKNDSNQVTGWVGWVYFASFMLLITGVFQIIMGFTALLNDEFYVIGNNTLLAFDVTTWGWIHLLLGLLMVVVGASLFAGRMWARVTAIVLASFNFVAQFAFISVYPWWSIIAMTLDVLVIYALTVHGDEVTYDK
ncbi:MAG: hypothetical protein WAQ27_06380 [Candidatus Microsaccharimonas sp.]